MNGSVRGFTLIELSIVLVIIGLIAGGVLVGQDLIRAAGVRAQISQIERYQTAANTFRGKYGYLPGDIKDPEATQFGFTLRGQYKGEGDGNGVLEGISANNTSGHNCFSEFGGELAMFWVDLTIAKLIDGSFATATPTAVINSMVSGSTIDKYFPQAKIGNGGYVYIWCGGWSTYTSTTGDSLNYFSITGTPSTTAGWGNTSGEVPLLTVAQAYAIDKKMDDGLPQSGGVLAMAGRSPWASGGPINPTAVRYETNIGDFDADNGGPITSATTNPYYDVDNGAALFDTCYNNGHTLQPEHYSVELNSGAGVNCVLSFRFQ